MKNTEQQKVSLDINSDLWNRLYSVHSLVIIGSREENGDYNFAPKHMAMPMGFSTYFGFIGTPRKTTYRNVKREGVFTVSYPRPSQVVISSLAASPREKDHTKPVVKEFETVKAQHIDGELMEDAYLHLECELEDILGSFGEWELMVGKVVSARAQKDAIRQMDIDSNDLIFRAPLLAYLHPDRFSIIKESQAFPFPEDFKR